MRSVRSSKTLLVEGLPLKSTNRDLNDHFSKFGPLTGCNIMINKETGQCRGFGFVTFLWDHHCKICADIQPHVIRGAKVTLRIMSDYNVKEFEMNLPTKVLLVSFVGKRLRKFDIMEYFSRFGAVNAEFGSNKENMANFAYVVFENEQMCRNCALSADHFISGYRVLVWPAVRREVYKVAEQAERERQARDERIKVEKEQQLKHSEFAFNLQNTQSTKSLSFIQQLPLHSQFSSCLVPPPPPPPPPLPQLQSNLQPRTHLHLQQNHSDIYSPSSIVNRVFINEQQLQTQSSHCWVPLLPSSTSSTTTSSISSHLRGQNDGNAGSLMAGYAGGQGQEEITQRTNDFLPKQSCISRKSRNTWARLADLPIHAANSANSYTTSHYFCKT